MAKNNKNNKTKQQQQGEAQAKKQVHATRNHLEEIGEDLMETANMASHEIAKDVKKGLKKTGKKVSKTLKRASASIDKMTD